jgi:GxxExxY protein
MNAYRHDPLTHLVIGCAIEVHRELGPGLAESTYEAALCIELTNAGIAFNRQPGVPVVYKGRTIGQYRPDLVIGDRLVIEIKSVERLAGVHAAQLLKYMQVLKIPVGLLLNFNGEVIRTGIKRLAL